jgi:hypothetical protein
MPSKHPYVVGAGGLTKAVAQFRKSFPTQVTAATLKKLGIAPNNESYVINTLRFLALIDDTGQKTKGAGSVFSHHSDDAFQAALAKVVEASYEDLFGLHGDGAWTLASDQLISFFRANDESSAIVGQRQAGTFQALAGLAGKAPTAAGSPKAATQPRAPKATAGRRIAPESAAAPRTPAASLDRAPRDLGLTVRVEINLPAVGDQATYDAIFASIRKNLIDPE